jgi:osmotically-inducible protein OsmY
MNTGTIRRLLCSSLAMMLAAAGMVFAQETDKQKQDEVIRIANQVRKKILMLGNYGPFDYIAFGVAPGEEGYTILLKGYASRPTLKESAEREVKKIENVGTVENRIEVLPTSGMDENIRLKAYASIYNHPSLSRYNPNYGTPIYGSARSFRNTMQMGISTNPPMGFHPISIIVKGGHIILEGVVDNESDKTVAGMQANQVSGVFSVTNNLYVTQPAKKKEK